MSALLAMPEIEAFDGPGPAETPALDPVRPASAPKRILVVDDDALVRASVAAVLDCEGYVVHGAADGEAALRSALEYQPDLVLLDLNMPNMDGWTAFVKLEHMRPLVPVIVITARPHQYQHAVEFGVDAFMEKPLNFPVLLRAIRKLTHESEERRNLRVTNPSFVTHLLDGHASNDF
jgi:DNA-binding response OmpR family regulator